MKRLVEVLLAFLLLAGLALFSQLAHAMGGKRKEPKPADPKPTLILNSIPNRFIELPGSHGSIRYYGENIYLRLVEELVGKQEHVILIGKGNSSSSMKSFAVTDGSTADPIWVDAPPIPIAEATLRVNEIAFQTGSRGTKRFYGFRRGNETPYNDGLNSNKKDEFRRDDRYYPNGFFAPSFNDTGGLRTGLDLGHSLNFDLLLVGANLKKNRYKARLGMELFLENRFGEKEKIQIYAQGKGFYFDLSGHLFYEGSTYRAGIEYARRVALRNAFNRVIKTAASKLSTTLRKLPIVTHLYQGEPGDFYVGVGANYRIREGQRFYNQSQRARGQDPVVFTVRRVYNRVSYVSVHGAGRFFVGDELISLKKGEKPPKAVLMRSFAAISGSNTKTSSETVNSKDKDYGIPSALKKFKKGYWDRLWDGIKALVTLPYRIWRYYKYDQKYKGGELWSVSKSRAKKLAAKSWALKQIGVSEAWDKVGLGSREMIVAVIDSGVDYNHKELRRNIYWDGKRNIPGWDFISWDARPYDDQAHGTEVASVIAGGGSKIIGVAPGVTILPVKIFSPYGETSSAAIYGAFRYAINSKAKVIVTAWATSKYSNAMRDALALARKKGVLVIASVGDRRENIDINRYYPASLADEFDNLIVVAGLSKNGGFLEKANYGWNSIDVVAPAEGIKVARPRDSYKTRSHAGLAAGLVAGSAALVWSSEPHLGYLEIKKSVLKGSQLPEKKGLYVPSIVDYINRD